MFKKKNTYFVLYYFNGNSRSKYSLFLTSIVNTTDPNSFYETFKRDIISQHKTNNGFVPENLMIESIQLISIEISLFGLRIF